MPTLGDRIAAREDSAFVGREREVATLEAMFSDDAPVSVAFVHGPGGVGKSALLRAAARRGSARGWTTVAIEGRDLPVDQDALVQALAPALAHERPLVLVDTYERLAPLDRVLRRDLLPGMPEHSVVVLASRRRPDPGWFQEGWEHLARAIELDELPAGGALALLAARGVDEATAHQILAWAGGSPLALTLAAETTDWAPTAGLVQPELLRRLMDRLIDQERDPVSRRALETAAIARVTTPELLAATLDEGDAAEAYAWLAGRSVAEPLGAGIALHDLARRALRADLRRRDPAGERDLRRRVIDHLYARAVTGDLELSLDLGDLTDDDVLRAGWVPEADLDAYVDGVGRDEVGALAAGLAALRGPEAGAALEVVVGQARDRCAVTRDSSGEVLGFCVSMTAATAPPAAEQDPILGRWLRHVRREGIAGESILIRDVVDFSGDGRAQALVNVTAFVRAGLANPRWCYSAVLAEDDAQLGFLRALGGVHLKELDGRTGEVTWQGWRIDYGPEGFLDFQRASLYQQMGLAVPAPLSLAAAAGDITADVRDALRNWHRPDKLAASPLATGGGTAARAAGLQERLLEAVQAGFGTSDEDRELRQTLEEGYMSPDGRSHEAVAEALYVSRSHYFRRLRTAVDRVALTLARDAAPL